LALETWASKDWRDDPDHSTPVTQAALEDAEQRLANWTTRVTLRGSGSPEGVVVANPGVVYERSDGGPSTSVYWKGSGAGNTGWIALEPPKRELAYQEITTSVTGFSAVADVAGLSASYTPTTSAVVVEAFTPSVQQQTVAGIGLLYVQDSAGAWQQRFCMADILAGKFFGSNYGKRRVTGLTPGVTYTAKVRAQTTAGTLDVIANANYPAFIRVYEA
jgi:hypothetical protein